VKRTEWLPHLSRSVQERGLSVVVLDEPPNTLDLGLIDGQRLVVVSSAHETTLAPFTLCHLFGHSVQFQHFEAYRALVSTVSQGPPLFLSEGFWNDFWQYEMEAFGYGRTLFASVGRVHPRIERCYAQFMAADFFRFRHFITTGKQSDREAFCAQLQTLYSDTTSVVRSIPPLPVPDKLAPVDIALTARIY
jgi:hypothetical protein